MEKKDYVDKFGYIVFGSWDKSMGKVFVFAALYWSFIRWAFFYHSIWRKSLVIIQQEVHHQRIINGYTILIAWFMMVWHSSRIPQKTVHYNQNSYFASRFCDTELGFIQLLVVKGFFLFWKKFLHGWWLFLWRLILSLFVNIFLLNSAK